MIDRGKLLSDLQSLLRKLEADLLERSDSRDVPEVGQTLRDEYQKAQKASRTAQSSEEWRSDYITQIAAAWVLSCVFARFLEDNRLVDPPRLAGPGEGLTRARDEHELYFRAHPTQTDREYLLHIFGELRKLPGAKEVFGEHNAVHELPNWLSGDAAGELLKFFQRIDANTGALVHDFTDANWDTRFLGDLYQDLSESARKKYALLQTPEFVEEFILDRTLDPAIEEFGLEDFRMIDPASGSGHFLLGSFLRILQRWLKREPGTNVRVLVQRSLNSVHGVDVNPYAVAIARFRLVVAALKSSNIDRLSDCPAFNLSLTCGDSLIHGAPYVQHSFDFAPSSHTYYAEDKARLGEILKARSFDAVVCNPPYITVKDKQTNQLYRDTYPQVCYGQYSLAVPFTLRMFHLARDAGFVGMITASSFSKAVFGKKLVEKYLPQVDLTHVIDTAGVYLPGHGTPTCILFARSRKPIGGQVRVAMGIAGEPGTPVIAAKGQVWMAILNQIDRPGSVSAFITVLDVPRTELSNHPWSIGGGGAFELKIALDKAGTAVINDVVKPPIGRAVRLGQEDPFVFERSNIYRSGVPKLEFRQFLSGDHVRDWSATTDEWVWYPYFDGSERSTMLKRLWMWRTGLAGRATLAGSIADAGLRWFDYQQHTSSAYKTPLSIVFAFVATHNHFVLDRGGKIFNRPAPIMKLAKEATIDDHLRILASINSSLGCFWLKQTCFPKGGDHVGTEGARVRRTLWDERFGYNGNNIKSFPLCSSSAIDLAHQLDTLGQQLPESLPASQLRLSASNNTTLVARLQIAERTFAEIRSRMISLQEELDWYCYRLYGVIDEDLTYHNQAPRLKLGQRAFEIVMARKMVAGDLETAWFERHRSKPITTIPDEWPYDYKILVQRRIDIIESNTAVDLMEQPDYKRRWSSETWEALRERALRESLLDCLEAYFDFDGRMNDDSKPTAQLGIKLVSLAKLSDLARQDTEFMQVGELYRDDPAFDVHKLVNELVADESIPHLPILRYKDSGLRKRAEWEQTWDLQRQEDAIDSRSNLAKDHSDYLSEIDAKDLKKRQLGDIPVPPKYTSADFLTSNYWRLRGKLDVPKERWVSFPYCEGEDGQMVIAWAGYDHLQLGKAISAYYVDIQERLGGRDDPRLEPLLASFCRETHDFFGSSSPTSKKVLTFHRRAS